MSDEVTRKDLQSLQGHCNKLNADVQKRIDNAAKNVGQLGKDMWEQVNLLNARCESLEAMEEKVGRLVKQIQALEARLAPLEKRTY